MGLIVHIYSRLVTLSIYLARTLILVDSFFYYHLFYFNCLWATPLLESGLTWQHE